MFFVHKTKNGTSVDVPHFIMLLFYAFFFVIALITSKTAIVIATAIASEITAFWIYAAIMKFINEIAATVIA